MPIKQLKKFLDEHKVKFVSIKHSIAYTAQEIAESAHISAKELAKVVIVKLDSKLVMLVVPASVKVDFSSLKKTLKAKTAELATENDFQDKFPGCDIGAMPPFGNLYKMPVYVADALESQDHIAFNAGTHSELMQLKYKDFKKLVKPKMIVIH